MARTTHDRSLDHRGSDLDTNIKLDGAIGEIATATVLHTALAALAYIKTGTASPAAGAGVASAIGSIYCRNNSGAGELWLKTASSNTSWTKITVP